MNPLKKSLRSIGIQFVANLLTVSPILNEDLFAQSENEATQVFKSLDTNKDGELSSADETQNNRGMLERIIQMAGKPKDGTVTRKEFDTVFETHRRGTNRNSSPTSGSAEDNRPTARNNNPPSRNMDDILMRLCDRDRDGRISRSEWNRLTDLFAQLDTNRDGAIDETERRGLNTFMNEQDDMTSRSPNPSIPQSQDTERPNSRPPRPNNSGNSSDSSTRSGKNSNLDGVWRGWVVRGTGENPNSGEMQIELTIKGSEIVGREVGTNRAPQGGLGSGTFAMTGDGKQGNMDAEQTEGPEKGKNYQGIFELSGNTLRWCVTSRNRNRPESFATERGNFLMILTKQ